ncbi:hypothetical protein EGT07_14065 [Herbaspirillum sp. HC18]|nr:hypothetical protein EGT07_14065 [Herbaspirillum sp. HC18]
MTGIARCIPLPFCGWISADADVFRPAPRQGVRLDWFAYITTLPQWAQGIPATCFFHTSTCISCRKAVNLPTEQSLKLTFGVFEESTFSMKERP